MTELFYLPYRYSYRLQTCRGRSIEGKRVRFFPCRIDAMRVALKYLRSFKGSSTSDGRLPPPPPPVPAALLPQNGGKMRDPQGGDVRV